jgi:pimeloyl-ACP methyl ester carboxylesterase
MPRNPEMPRNPGRPSCLSVGMRTAREAATVAVLLAVAASTAGCHGPAPQSAPTLRPVACPSDVEVDLVASHACFRLAVPVDRRHPSGPQVSLFVLRLTPPGTPVPSADPMLDLGADVGNTPGYGGMAALPARVHRVTYILDPRGSAHSTPSQACPEARIVTALVPDEATALAGAAQRCLARLRAAGDDPALFDPANVAADAVDLRHALGVARWNVITFGSTSIYADALVQRDGAAVRSVVQDSPAPTTTANPSVALSTAWQELVAECVTDAGCHGAYPKVAGLWQAAAAKVRTVPVAVSGGVIDDTVLTRVVGSVLTRGGPDGPALLPGDLAALSVGSVPSDVADVLAGDSAACVGSRPECTPGVSLGALLTATCPMQAGAGDLYAKACAIWPHARSPLTASGPLQPPTLILFGALDPYVDQAALLARRGGHTYVVRVPHQTHNTLGYDDCPISLRNAWVDHPDGAPPTGCLATMPSLPFDTSG